MASSNTQPWVPELYQKNARFISDMGLPVVGLLSPNAESVFCTLVAWIASFPSNWPSLAVGPSAWIQAARLLGLEAHILDGQAFPFDDEFDAANNS